MELTRRTALGASLAIAATPLLPRVAYASQVPIEWAPGALGHKFEPLAGSWCAQRIREGLLYLRGGGLDMDRVMKLTQPRFKIVPGKRVFNWMTGYTDETGLAIYITEKGVPIGEAVGIGTSIGYEEYWGSERPDNMPDYYVRQPWLTWDEFKHIQPHLPEDHFEYDMRGLIKDWRPFQPG